MIDVVIKGYSFTPMNNTTQRGEKVLARYNWSKKSDIYDAYKNPSYTKVSTFYQLKRKMEDLNGYGMKITGAGSDQYSCAFLITDDKTDKTYLIYETSCNSYIIEYNNE